MRKEIIGYVGIICIGAIIFCMCFALIKQDIRPASWRDDDYINGIDKGIQICQEHYITELKDYIHTPNCLIIIKEEEQIKYICNAKNFYNSLLNTTSEDFYTT